MNRRDLLKQGIQFATIVSAGRFLISETRAASASRYAQAFPLLDQFVEQYLHDMNAPGLTLSLADADGAQRVCAYGFDDVATRRTLNSGQLFHIGSISKSFAAICLLQLHDEGRVDLHKPIKSYLPWLRFDPATRPLSAHDLLTHGAALPDGPLFPADPAFRYRATAAPGAFFHYCNMGYEAIGHLVAALDGKPLADVFRTRIFTPLGMTATEPFITLDIADKIAGSYWPVLNDRPYPRRGKLMHAQPTALSSAAGCIASTAGDMAAYLAALINHGRTPGARLISEAGFQLFSTRHIEAAEFGPGAAYGYGIAIDALDGHKRLRHTGGMMSFASALEIDLDSGVGAFASINAMQGYRPRPVAEYALRLMRACREGSLLPKPPASNPSNHVANAADYAGRFTADDGHVLEIAADGGHLNLVQGNALLTLEPDTDGEDRFTVLHPDFAKYALCFGRGGADHKGAVVEAAWGEQWFKSARYAGAAQVSTPQAWHQFTGHYRNEDPWIGSHHVVLRRGKLWLNGVTPLEPAADGRFFLRDEAQSPEWVLFSEIVNGSAQRMTLSGAALWRSA